MSGWNEDKARMLSSQLIRRINLEPSDRDFMPRMRAKLSAEDIALIEAWVAAQ